MRFRKGSKRFAPYCSGQLVYLYDPAHREQIERDGKGILLEGSDAKGKKALDLARKGLLVAYELRGDDSPSIEFAVGDPLSAEELGRGRWLPLQTARLTVTSGVLHIDTPDTLRIGDEEPTDEGVTVKVPSGDYVVTLHRTDWDGLAAGLIDAKGFPTEVVTLTPVTSTTAPKVSPPRQPALPFMAPRGRAAHEPSGVTVGASWRGVIVEGGKDSTFEMDLDEKAAAKLGLAWGDRLRVKVGKREVEALYLDRMSLDEYVHTYGKARLVGPPVRATASWCESRVAKGKKLLWINMDRVRFGIKNDETRFGAALKAPVEIVKTPEPLEPRDPSSLGKWALEKKRLSGKVLHHSSDMVGLPDTWIETVVLDIDQDALAKVRARPGDRLVLRVGKLKRALYLVETFRDCCEAKENASRLPPEQKAQEREVYYEWRKAGFSLDPKQRDEKRAAKLRKKLDELYLPPGVTEVETVGCLEDHWFVAEKRVLRVYPLLNGRGFEFPVAIGTPISLGKK
jgi:hypothetical protein